MNRKTLTILIATAVILIGGITFAVMKLYSDSRNDAGNTADSRFLETHKLVKAVPSDAAIIFCFKNFGRACEILGDSLAVFGELASNKFDRITSLRSGSLKKSPAIMSVHYSKDMPPLMIIEAGKAIADTTQDLRTLIAAADSSGLLTRINGDLLLISTSETVINSSVRHLEEGHSILEAKGFAEIASTGTANGDDVIFLSNAYMDNFLGTYFAKKHRKSRNFLKELAEWTALTITKRSDAGVSMHGTLLYGSEPSYYLNVLSHAGSSEMKIAEVVPSSTDFIIDITIGNITSYIKAYRNYLDSKSSLDRYEAILKAQKKEFGQNAEEWAESLGINEVAVLNLKMNGKLRQILTLRPGKKLKAENVSGMKCAGFASSVFGNVFTAEDESTCALAHGWIVIGAADCVAEYSKTNFLRETLASRLDAEGLDRVPQKNGGAWVYYSLGNDPELLDATFSPMMARGCRNILKGASYVPVVISAIAEGGGIGLEINLDRIEVGKGSVPAAGKDTTVTVPEGPFKVRNCATGKINTFYQNSHLSICLRDENGKDVWGVPFKSKIRGYVQEVDYYNNGKIQYLFAAGSQMYLIDRLGRFVSGFPAETGKKIAAGPAVYDFTGAKGYTAMLLHTDNTVGYYDLHGKQVPSWKGITADETIKSLPELLEGNGKRYWVVRTSAQSMVFPFIGGEPLIKGEGNKMIRPDSKIEITDKGFSAVCYDGKERTFKPGK